MKQCNFCGAMLSDETIQCPFCGANVETSSTVYVVQQPVRAYSGVQANTKPMNKLGLAGMILGILSYAFSWVPVLGFLLGLIGVCLSGVAMSVRAYCRLNGFAIAGLVLSIIGLVGGFTYTIVLFVLMALA